MTQQEVDTQWEKISNLLKKDANAPLPYNPVMLVPYRHFKPVGGQPQWSKPKISKLDLSQRGENIYISLQVDLFGTNPKGKVSTYVMIFDRVAKFDKEDVTQFFNDNWYQSDDKEWDVSASIKTNAHRIRICGHMHVEAEFDLSKKDTPSKVSKVVYTNPNLEFVVLADKNWMHMTQQLEVALRPKRIYIRNNALLVQHNDTMLCLDVQDDSLKALNVFRNAENPDIVFVSDAARWISIIAE